MRKVIYTVIVGVYDKVRPLPAYKDRNFVPLASREPLMWRSMCKGVGSSGGGIGIVTEIKARYDKACSYNRAWVCHGKRIQLLR